MLMVRRKECFVDEDIVSALERGTNDDVETVKNYLNAVLSLFELTKTYEDSRELGEILTKEWSLFKNDKLKVEEILEYMNSPIHVNDRVLYREKFCDGLEAWKRVKNDVKANRRFFCDYTEIEGFLIQCDRRSFSKKQSFYRARVHNKPDEPIFRTEEMGCPTAISDMKSGRANPSGIAYLYLCTDSETPFYEVRSNFLDRVDVGKFELLDDIVIMDFTQKPSLFSTFCMDGENAFQDSVRQMLFLQAISRELSKPLRSYDTELEYVATQSISEYCKILGLDGIMYMSSLREGGKNIVLFDSRVAKCVSVMPYEVNKINIEKVRYQGLW